MKNIILVMFALMPFILFAHEGGHGQISESGKFGGTTSPVVEASKAGMGNKAPLLFKSELVRSESGKLSLYLFDKEMKVLDLRDFSTIVEAKLEIKKKGKFTYFGNFKLTKNGNHFTGQLPKVEYRPFNIDFFFEKGKQKLFVGYSDLD